MKILHPAAHARFGALMLLALTSALALPGLSRASATHGGDPAIYRSALERDFTPATQGLQVSSGSDEEQAVGDDEAIGTNPVTGTFSNEVRFVCVHSAGVFHDGVGQIFREIYSPGEAVWVMDLATGLTFCAHSVDGPSTQDLVAPGESVTISWTSNGKLVTVTMVQQPGETDDGLTIRLARRVVALQKSFPDTAQNHP